MQGDCLCGAVRFTSPPVRQFGACHCGYCRRWGGGAMLAVHCGPDVTFTGSEQITVYASSAWAQRAFCRQCGTHLYYKLLATGEHFIPAGAFETDDFEMASQIYIDRKPPYYAFANETPTMTEQQVMALYGEPGGGE